jgi:hypothetical protein
MFDKIVSKKLIVLSCVTIFLVGSAGAVFYNDLTSFPDVGPLAESQPLVFHQLLYNSISHPTQSNFVFNFSCPNRDYWFPYTFTPQAVLPIGYDFNRLVNFTITEHINPKTGLNCTDSGAIVQLYVAIHNDNGTIKVCVQRSDAEGAIGIRASWWNATR